MLLQLPMALGVLVFNMREGHAFHITMKLTKAKFGVVFWPNRAIKPIPSKLANSRAWERVSNTERTSSFAFPHFAPSTQCMSGTIYKPETSITNDEVTSGVIHVTELLDREDDKTYSLLVVQNHKLSGDPVTVEGGQLILLAQPPNQMMVMTTMTVATMIATTVTVRSKP